jgi:hypothetical protein
VSGSRFRAEIAQLVEHATENCGVPSSNLGLGTRPPSMRGLFFVQLQELRPRLKDPGLVPRTLNPQKTGVFSLRGPVQEELQWQQA